MPSRKRIAVLGSTGSIGRSVMSVLELNPDAFEVVSLSALKSAELLAEQAERFGVRRVAIGEDAAGADALGEGLEVGVGEEALVALASDPEADLVVNALVGTAGLPVTAAAVSAGKRLAVANKESLVMAGELVTRVASETGAELIPVDSEHSSIFRCVKGAAPGEVRGVVLTASGGPLRDAPMEDLKRADVSSVLAHPTWDMGEKITVDSATLVNKAMEVVEARWLFDLPLDSIDVALHRQSIVHSFVQMHDGSLLAHLGTPDMRVPIQYALFYPDVTGARIDELRPADIGSLDFEPVDPERYPCFGLVLESARAGGTAPTIAATADEAAVGAFLAGEILFGDIAAVIAGALEALSPGPADTLSAVLAAEADARAAALEVINSIAGRASAGAADASGAARSSGA